MRIEIIPECCEIIKQDDGTERPAEFSGQVTLDLPSYPVLQQMKKEALRIASKLKKIGANDDDTYEKISSGLDLSIMLYEKIAPMIVDVSLVHIKKSKAITTLEDFSSYPYCGKIIDELCLKLMQGFVEKN